MMITRKTSVTSDKGEEMKIILSIWTPINSYVLQLCRSPCLFILNKDILYNILQSAYLCTGLSVF